MTRLAKLWIPLAAVTITALLTVSAGLLASSAMGVMLADHHGKWWWPVVIQVLANTGWMTAFLPVGIALYLYRRRVRRETFPHLSGLRRLPR
jgi:membrane protein YdbS with pleckstrin-like domain